MGMAVILIVEQVWEYRRWTYCSAKNRHTVSQSLLSITATAAAEQRKTIFRYLNPYSLLRPYISSTRAHLGRLIVVYVLLLCSTPSLYQPLKWIPLRTILLPHLYTSSFTYYMNQIYWTLGWKNFNFLHL